VLEKDRAALLYVASGRIRSDESAPLAERLAQILAGLAEVIESYAPAEVAVEKVFVNVNPQSTLLLGQARGAAICAAVMAKLPVSEYTALQVKKSVVGAGHARKEQVQEMVKRLLRLPGHPSSDAADALACAICHAHGGMGLGAIPTRGRSVRAGRIA
jgi:crossover junction endodeoxyribonuclease RuvC